MPDQRHGEPSPASRAGDRVRVRFVDEMADDERPQALPIASWASAFSSREVPGTWPGLPGQRAYERAGFTRTGRSVPGRAGQEYVMVRALPGQ